MIVRCRFDERGQLAILAMKKTDLELGDLPFGARFDPRGAPPELAACAPATLGFDGLDAPYDVPVTTGHRTWIWDLAIRDGVIVAAFDDGVVEQYRATGECVRSDTLHGQAVQLLSDPMRLLVHVVEPSDNWHYSSLFVVEPTGLTRRSGYDSGRSCSIDRFGRILARNFGRHAHDFVNAGDKTTLLIDSFGHFDAKDHSIRIDGADALYFLRGDPPSGNEHKQLRWIDVDMKVHSMSWDVAPKHLSCACAAIVDGAIVRACHELDTETSRGEWIVERVGTWRHAVGGAATALVSWPAAGAVVFALTDGALGIVDANTGDVYHQEPLVLDGVPTIPMALAVHGRCSPSGRSTAA